MKVDLVMWAKNGAKMLPYVLNRIEKVIPQRNINNRIFVDDHSSDNSIEIAKDIGWKTYENKEGGIGSGANIALKHVATPFFVSLEQDVLLAKNWWQKIPRYMKDPKVAVARGVRVPTHTALRILYECHLERFGAMATEPAGIDNNMFRTNVIREVGGFPPYPITADAVLKERVIRAGYKWLVDGSVVSDHIRRSIWQHAFYKYKHIMVAEKTTLDYAKFSEFYRILKTFMFSPLRGLQITLSKKCPQVFFAYPFLRFVKLKTFLDRKKKLGKL